MLDRRFIRDNPDAVKDAVRVKGVDLDVDELLELDDKTRKLQHELDEGRARKRALSKEFAKADASRSEELRAESSRLDDSYSSCARSSTKSTRGSTTSC